jgi:hypothetical protein
MNNKKSPCHKVTRSNKFWRLGDIALRNSLEFLGVVPIQTFSLCGMAWWLFSQPIVSHKFIAFSLELELNLCYSHSDNNYL